MSTGYSSSIDNRIISHPKIQLGIIFLYLIFDRTINLPVHNISFFSTLYLWLPRIFIIIYFFRFLNIKKTKYVQLIIIFLLLYLFELLIPTASFGSVSWYFTRNLPVVGLSLFLIVECRDIYHTKNLIHSISCLYFILASINLFLMIVAPNLFGVGEGGAKYLIGNENGVGFALLLGFMFNYLNGVFNNYKKLFWIYTIIYVITVVINFSGSAIVALFIMLLFLYVPPVNNYIEKRKHTFLLLLYVFVFVIITLYQTVLFQNNSTLSYIINNILGNDNTFAGRTYIWEVVISNIRQRPLLGSGIQTSLSSFLVYGVNSWDEHMSHNQILQILYEGGVISLAILLSFIIKVGIISDNCHNLKLSHFFKVVIFGLFLMFLMECVGVQILFCIIIMSLMSYTYIKQ